MNCASARRAELTGRNMRAHFTTCPKRPAASDHVISRGGTRKPSADAHRGGECCADGAAERDSTASWIRGAFRRLLQAAMVLKAKDYAPKGRGTAGRCRVRQIG